METVSESLLRERFADLWRRMGAAEDGGRVFDDLLRAYQEPHRHYHGVDHLRDCLEQLDAAPASAAARDLAAGDHAAGDHAARDLAETALWFHDAIYVPSDVRNEARSALWATRALVQAGAPAERAHEVARVVRLTDHARPAQDAVGALVGDVDLSILGRPPSEFAEYERRVRAEHGGIPEPLYRMGRASVLAHFLARDPLYRTDHFRALYEDSARRNLKRSMESLGTAREAE